MKQIYGFIFADDMEFKPFRETALKQGGIPSEVAGMSVVTLELPKATIVALHGGVGKVYATIAAMTLIKDYKVDYLMSAGLSGAISGLNKGDVVAGEEYVECDFDVTPFGYRPGEKTDGTYLHKASPKLLTAAKAIPGMQTGRLGTGDFFLTDPAIKQKYRDTFGIQAFDMESAAMASACDKYGVPFLSIRKISDDADDHPVESYQAMNNLAETALTELLLETVQNMGK